MRSSRAARSSDSQRAYTLQSSASTAALVDARTNTHFEYAGSAYPSTESFVETLADPSDQRYSIYPPARSPEVPVYNLHRRTSSLATSRKDSPFIDTPDSSPDEKQTAFPSSPWTNVHLSEKDELGDSTSSAASKAGLLSRFSRDEASWKKLLNTPTEGRADPRSRRWTSSRLWMMVVLAVLGIAAVLGTVVGLKTHRHEGATKSNSAAVITKGVASLTAATAAPTAGTTSASLAPNRLVVMGASYCDNAHNRSAQYSASLKPPPYYQGRESNGIVWDEYLPSMINAGDLRNYAYSGAMVSNSIYGANVPDLKTQIQSYLADISSGSIRPLKSGRTLIAIWIGLNSVMAVWDTAQTKPFTARSNATALASIDASVAALQTQVEGLRSSLIALNVSADFMVLPLPPTELLPFARYTPYGGSTLPKWLLLIKNFTLRYNSGVNAVVDALENTDGSSALSYDVPDFFYNLVANPSLGNVTDVNSACVVGTSECADPPSHLWWDSIHLTTGIHKLVASTLAPSINSFWAAKS